MGVIWVVWMAEYGVWGLGLMGLGISLIVGHPPQTTEKQLHMESVQCWSHRLRGPGYAKGVLVWCPHPTYGDFVHRLIMRTIWIFGK